MLRTKARAQNGEPLADFLRRLGSKGAKVRSLLAGTAKR
jgi:hypothetical protein